MDKEQGQDDQGAGTIHPPRCKKAVANLSGTGGEGKRENGPAADDPNLSRAGATAENSIKLLIYGRSTPRRFAERGCVNENFASFTYFPWPIRPPDGIIRRRVAGRLLKRLSRGEASSRSVRGHRRDLTFIPAARSSFSEFPSLEQHPSSGIQIYRGESRKKASKDFFRRTRRNRRTRKSILKINETAERIYQREYEHSE